MNWEIEVCYIIHSDLITKTLYMNVKNDHCSTIATSSYTIYWYPVLIPEEIFQIIGFMEKILQCYMNVFKAKHDIGSSIINSH